MDFCGFLVCFFFFFPSVEAVLLGKRLGLVIHQLNYSYECVMCVSSSDYFFSFFLFFFHELLLGKLAVRHECKGMCSKEINIHFQKHGNFS